MKANKTYIIRNKQTKEIWRASSGKTSWKATNHAKTAFHVSSYYRKYFDDQDIYEIVELKHDAEDKLNRAIELLKVIRQTTDYIELYIEVDEFIKEVESDV